MKKLITGNWLEYLIASFLGVIISLVSLSIPSKHLAPFDSQALLTWQFSQKIGALPYRDVFYPYGFFEYFSSCSALFEFFSLVLIGALSFSVYVFLKEILQNSILSRTYYAVFLLFVSFFVGFESYSRYGVVVAFAILSAFLFSKKRINRKLIFRLGVLSSIIFSLINDQGVYCCVVFLTAMCFFVKGGRQKAISLLSFGMGVVTGLIPLSIYLISNNSLTAFVEYLAYFKQINEFAKTPFFPGVVTLGNVFVFLSLFLTGGLLGHAYFEKRALPDRTNYYLSLFYVSLLLLEYKNTIRSIEWQITFIGFLLMPLLWVKVLKIIKQAPNSSRLTFLLTCSLPLLVLIVFFMFDNSKISESGFTRMTTGNIKSDIIRQIEKNEHRPFAVFSYPADPDFYMENNQRPPYFFSLYEATPMQSQLRQIEYINDMKVSYVIVNLENYAVQDQVPNYVRGRLLTSYIFTEFYPYRKIGNHLILRKGKGDIFAYEDIVGQEYLNYLKEVDLKDVVNIFPIEVRRSGIITLSQLPSQVYETKELSLSSDNTLVFNKSLNGKVLVLTSKEGYSTRIRLHNCRLENCFIDLSFVPLFFKQRKIIHSKII